MGSFVIGPFITNSRTLDTRERDLLANNVNWTLSTLEPIHPATVLGTANAQTVSFDIVRADIDNIQSDALTLASYSATSNLIDLNHDRDIKTQLNLALRQSDALDPYVDFVSVWLNREWDDGRDSTRDQLGLFGIRVPQGIRTVERAEATYTGYDLTATLARYAFTEAYNIAASSNYVDAVTDILALAGITRHLIEPTTQTTAAVISYPPGTTYLAACNALLQSIGYYSLSAMPDGRLMSRPTRDLRYVEPYRTITDADLMRPVEVQPLDTTVANVIIVVKDNLNAAPLTATRRNDAADSPTSTANLGTITRVVSRGDLADQDAVDALADRLLSEGRSFYQTAKLSVLPDPRALIPHQTIELNLTGKLAVLNGRWWCRKVKVPLNTKATELEINRISDTINGSII